MTTVRKYDWDLFCFLIGGFIGAWLVFLFSPHKLEINNLKKEALDRNHAYYLPDEEGKPIFTWRDADEQ